jgi:DNA-binding transcriptional regulator YiaG
MNKQRCPACGSIDIIDEKKSILIKEPFGGQNNIEIHENICSLCGSRGDFFNQNETLIDETIKKLKQKSIENILNNFIDSKISMSSIERALEIPQRTLTKWKNRTNLPSSTGVALMRFIKLFPWLLEVAENKYDYNEAQKIHINAAIQKLLPEINFRKNDFIETGGIVATSGSALFYKYYEKKDINNQEKIYNEVTLATNIE